MLILTSFIEPLTSQWSRLSILSLCAKFVTRDPIHSPQHQPNTWICNITGVSAWQHYTEGVQLPYTRTPVIGRRISFSGLQPMAAAPRVARSSQLTVPWGHVVVAMCTSRSTSGAANLHWKSTHETVEFSSLWQRLPDLLLASRGLFTDIMHNGQQT